MAVAELDSVAVAQAGLVHSAAIRLVVTVSEGGEVAAHQRFTSNHWALARTNSGVASKLRDIIHTSLGVSTE